MAGRAIGQGTPGSGTINRNGDRYAFSGELEAGRRYRIDGEGSATSRGTLANPIISGIRNAEGKTLGNRDVDDQLHDQAQGPGDTPADSKSGDGGNVSPESTTRESGEYFIIIRGGTGTYTLRVTEQ